MSRQKRVGIIGHFGGNQDFLDGQTVKTKILYEELKNVTAWRLVKVDTYYKKKNFLKLIFQTLGCLFSCKDIFVLLSGNGMKLYFPILYFCAKVFRKRIYHDVIGGNLNDYVINRPKFKKYLNSFRVNWVETKKLQEELMNNGILNVEIMPNFKRLNIITYSEAQIQTPYRFCTFSRVMQEKGIETALETIEEINREHQQLVCTLDIYGPIDDGYKDRFDNIMQKVTPAINYLGKVPFNKSVEVLKNYHALLFPTFWKGEGFAGTIVDAFSAGLPVIATDWNCNGEIIEHGKNGF